MPKFITAGLLMLVAAGLPIAEADQGPNPNLDLSVKVPRPRDPLADADDVTRQKMGINVDTPANDRLPLGDMLTFLSDRFDVKFAVKEGDFAVAGVRDVLKKEVIHPQVRKVPIARVLSEILSQVRGEFYVQGDTIYVVPKRLPG
jgi:hypothetical protein